MSNSIPSTEPQLNNQHTKSEFWRRGKPALALTALTLLLVTYSYFFVQPNLVSQYKKSILHSCGKVGITEQLLLSKLDSTDNKLRPSLESKALELTEKIALLEDAQLRLQRLSSEANDDDALRYDSAIVSISLADLYDENIQRLLKSGEQQKNGSVELENLISKSLNRRQEAMSNMQSIANVENGSVASMAKLWLMERQLANATLSSDISDRAIQDLQAVLATEPTNENARILMLRALTLSSLSVDGPSINQRLKFANVATAIANEVSAPTIKEQLWFAQSLQVIDPIAAQDLAFQSAQPFWSQKASVYNSVETLEAVFESLIINKNLTEAQAFVGEHLPKMTYYEQVSFRSQCAANCIRQTVAFVLNENVESQNNEMNSSRKPVNSKANIEVTRLIDLAVLLAPESDFLIAYFDTIAQDESKNEIAQRLASKFAESDDKTCEALLNSIRALRQNEEANLSHFVEHATSEKTSYAIVAAASAIKLAQTNQTTTGTAIAFLKLINDARPEILLAWSNRAKLHMLQQELPAALECLYHLQNALPENREIGQQIEAVQRQLEVPKDQTDASIGN